jgi:hypothetical protein
MTGSRSFREGVTKMDLRDEGKREQQTSAFSNRKKNVTATVGKLCAVDNVLFKDVMCFIGLI